MSEGFPEYRSTSSLEWWLTILLTGNALLCLVSLGTGLMEIDLLHDAMSGKYVSRERALSNDDRQQLIGKLGLVLILPLGFLYLRWIYRANQNARSLGAEDMKFTPGWAVGYFFIPILHFFRPYQAMKEIWQASVPEKGDWHEKGVPSLLGTWWGLWILSDIAGKISGYLDLQAMTTQDYFFASSANFLCNLVAIPLSIAALMVVRQIHANQEAKSRMALEELFMLCPSCGERVSEEITICPVCGHSLESKQEGELDAV